ncbi:MAG: hypothetical protein EXR28_08230 [Betaproteobacteria bacterium]|nr:hypothetical protein [Betaproteobacteria bacterium]
MNISAIGPMAASSIGSLSGLGGASPTCGASAGGIAASLGSTDVLTQLLDLINSASLSPASKVAISDAAKVILDGDDGSASMGELSQALIVALLLQLLEV